MILIDYTQYLEQQALYAESFKRQALNAADRREQAEAEKFGELAGDAYLRVTRMLRRAVDLR